MRHRDYLKLAIPLMISTITQPILGAVDTAVVGHLNDTRYIGGVAIGAVVFNTIYWLFGFLRVSTSGYTAQADGMQSREALQLAYLRPIILAGVISVLIILGQWFLGEAVQWIYKSDEQALIHAMTYFKILIWGAPFVLIGYVNLGWLMGDKRIKETLFLQISANILNIVLDVLFVIYLDMKVAGVAYATLISQVYAFILGTALIYRHLDIKGISMQRIQLSSLKQVMLVNSDLMIRTICLLAMTNLFMSQSAKFGSEVLAANAVLYQVQYLISYLLDGFSNASSIFAGRYKGAQDSGGFEKLIKLSGGYALSLAALSSVGILLVGDSLFNLFTNLREVIDICLQYKIWLVVFPFSIAHGMIYYGLFTGSTQTASVRNSMILSLMVFALVLYVAVPKWGNHGLWLAFILFSLCRSIYLIGASKRLIFSESN